MVRTRSHEAPLVGLLAALAAFCALEARRGGQPYSIVGQSSADTAATGRRPLAERIKAANRPIRIAAEAELAPDRGLIPALSRGVEFPPEREWALPPVVVEMPEGVPTIVVDADQPTVASSPAIVPPPEAEALAANPTTADDAGLVAETSSTDPTASTPGVLQSVASDEVEGAGESEAPRMTGPIPRPGNPIRVAPPRRAQVRVTPQRREAFLSRLRAALAAMPHPLGLVPAAPTHRPLPRQPRQNTHQHSPATSAPAQLAEVPAAAIPHGAAMEEVAADGADAAADASAADHESVASTDEPNGAAGDEGDRVEEAPLCDASTAGETPHDDTLVFDSADPTSAAGEESAAVEADTAGIVSEDVAIATETVAATDQGTILRPEYSLPGTPQPSAAPRQVTGGVPGSKSAGQRVRAPAAVAKRQGPFDRLQARLEAMPRSLGLVPAPRPSMHAGTARRPRATVTHGRPPVAPRELIAAQPAPDETIAPESIESADESQDGGRSIADNAAAELVVEPASDLAATPVTVPSEQADLTPTDGQQLADTASVSVSADDDATDLGSVAEPTAAGDDSPLVAATETPTGTETATVEAPAAAPETLRSPPAPARSAHPTRQAQVPRQSPRQVPRSVSQRPFRDRIAAALAELPRPLGILPAPQPAPARRSAAPRSPGAAPQMLAHRHAVPRPLDTTAAAPDDVAVAAPEGTDSAPEEDATTLASGSDVHDETMPVGPDAAMVAEGAPAQLPSLPESDEVATACIEVTVAAPEEATVVGEQVTLHFTIRNIGNAPASAVTPVIHFAAGLEPVGIQGRHGSVTAEGSVVFDRCHELAAGESVEIDVIATCTAPGQVAYQGVAWCGEGAAAEQVPVDGQVNVVPARLAAEPSAVPRRR